MKFKSHKIDEAVFGGAVLELLELNDLEQLSEGIDSIERSEQPVYMYTKVEESDIALIHELEQHGFRFVETQFNILLQLKDQFNAMSYFPYKIAEVTERSELDRVFYISDENFSDNRISADKQLKHGTGNLRYKGFINQSFENENEHLFKIYNSQSNEIVGFQSGKLINQKEAQMFLGGLCKDYQQSLSGINYELYFAELVRRGFFMLRILMSGKSFRHLNFEIKGYDYQIEGSKVVLRKICKNQ